MDLTPPAYGWLPSTLPAAARLTHPGAADVSEYHREGTTLVAGSRNGLPGYRLGFQAGAGVLRRSEGEVGVPEQSGSVSS